MNHTLRILCLLTACAATVVPACAQWTTQTIALQPGWNAVFLEVQPEPRQCDQLFAGTPVLSAWAWNRRFSPVQFIQDPNSLVPGDPDWLVWTPAAIKNLFILEGGRSYLIRISGAATFNWQLSGRPAARRIDWISDSLNLVGFGIDGQSPPTFAKFFAGSAAHAGQPVYRLNAGGLWQPITDPATATLQRGEAFWIRCVGQSSFAGPLRILFEQGTALNYGKTLNELRLRIRNESGAPRSFTVQQLPSTAVPNTNHPPLAGAVALSYFRMNLASNEYGFVPLPSPLANLVVASGEERELRLAVRRADMAPAPPGALYQSLLEITEPLGVRQLIGVTSEGLQTGTTHRRAGLWVGSAVIQRVGQGRNATEATNPVPVATECQFRLIVHVDALGQARLLQQAVQAWQEATESQPGRTLLLSDASKLTNYPSVQFRRRFSSAAFASPGPVPLSGSGEFGANLLTGTVLTGYDDALNPFKHRYHPDHDNLNAAYSAGLAAGEESFTITREVTLQFTADDPDGLHSPGWADSQLGGVYRERMSGVHRYPLSMEGTFRLHRASRLSELNPAN
jgi:hypothetical protein